VANLIIKQADNLLLCHSKIASITKLYKMRLLQVKVKNSKQRLHCKNQNPR